MPFRPGQSGNAKGRPRGVSPLLTGKIRQLVEKDAVAIVSGIIEAAKLGDPAARQIFVRYLLPRHRYVSDPIQLPVIDNLAEARSQIAKLASLGMQGLIDLDSMLTLSRTIALAAGLRLEELEDILEAREDEQDAIRHDH
jgi:hypothetical protein